MTSPDTHPIFANMPHTQAQLRAQHMRDLMAKADQLAQVLVHECGPADEHCYCFGQGDVDAYEAVRAELASFSA